MLTFLKRNRHILALLPFVLATVWFFFLEKINIVPAYYVEAPLDDDIPFIPWLVIPYVLWYLYIGGTLVFYYFASPREFVRLCALLAAGMMVACAVYALFPNGQMLRPRNPGKGAFGEMIGAIYRADTPTNSLPSIHVIYTMVVHISLAKYLNGRRAPVCVVSFILALLICASTVGIKQHSILDIFAGVFVVFILNLVFYGQRVHRVIAEAFEDRRTPSAMR